MKNNNKKKTENFHFYSCVLHGRVFVMLKITVKVNLVSGGFKLHVHKCLYSVWNALHHYLATKLVLICFRGKYSNIGRL